MHLNSSRPRRRRATGFTLVELLVTLLIVSVGMLGLVKMEAAAVSESQVSRVRSLLTLQAESLAGTMRADRGYWAATTSPFPSFTADGVNTPTYPTSNTSTCIATACLAPSDMATADLRAWYGNFSTAFPGAQASIACTPTGACVAGGTVPASYDIKLSWSEKTVGISASSKGSAAPTSANVSMVLHVQP